VGAVIGAATYVGQAAGSGSGSWRGFAGSVLAGAATGFVSPVPAPILLRGAVTISGSFIGFYAGFAGGLVERDFDHVDAS